MEIANSILHYMTLREASLFLCTSLSGEAEEELEHADLDRTNSASGIDYIDRQLKLGLQTKTVYQKRKFMADYEAICETEQRICQGLRKSVPTCRESFGLSGHLRRRHVC